MGVEELMQNVGKVPSRFRSAQRRIKDALIPTLEDVSQDSWQSRLREMEAATGFCLSPGTIDGDDPDFWRDGVQVFHPTDDVTRIANALASSLEPLDASLHELERFISEDKVLVAKSGAFTYPEAVRHPKSVLITRGGDDEGMLDVFNIDRWKLPGIDSLAETMRETFKSIIGHKTAGWEENSLNLYLNESVGSTRGFHVDSYGHRQVKVFCYLTDVRVLSDGPFTYLRGSHLDVPLRAMNEVIVKSSRTLRPTDWPLVDHGRIFPALGTAGTILISNQSGAHRGWPQESRARRLVLVQTFVSQHPLIDLI